MAHVPSDNTDIHTLINTDHESTTSRHVVDPSEHSGDTAAPEATLPSPIAIVMSPTSTAEGQGAVAAAGNAVSFSPPLQMERSLGDSSYQTRRLHEFGSSPARSLVHVLETAGAVEGSQDDQWVPNASGATTGTSGVHFQPQRSHYPNHFKRTGSGPGGGGGWMATSMPESRFSEFEVVYDDGVRKQRTFSLTTEMDEDERTSSDNEGSEHDPLLEYQEIEPSDHDNPQQSDDGTYGHYGYPGRMQEGAGTTSSSFPPSHPSAHNHSTTPLLNKQCPSYSSSPAAGVGGRLYPQQPKRRNRISDYFARASQTTWSYVSGSAIPLPTRRILKASLAYLLACLVSFTPFFAPYVGMSGHLAATSAVFFNPAKSLGRMVDAVTAGLCAIAFGVFVSVSSMLSAIWFNSRDLYIWGHVVSVIVFGGGSTFVIAYAKAYFNRPTVSEGALNLGGFNLARVLAITTSMLLGVLISTLISIFLWPESAHEKLRQDMEKSLISFRLLLKLLTKTFLLESDTTPFGSEPVQKLIETQVKSFSALAKSLEEAQLEFPGADIKKYEACVKSLNTLAQYLNGLRSSCGLQYDMLKKDEHLKESAPKTWPVATSTQAGSAGAGVGVGNGSRTGGRKAMGFGMRMSSFSLIGSMSQDQEQSASADLIEFLDHVGKPMKSLALTCKLTIEHLQDIFTSTDGEQKASLGRYNSRSRVSQSNARQSGYDSGEVFSDSTNDPNASTEAFKKGPSLVLMQINLAKALDIFEKANSKALKRFYAHQNKRRSRIARRPMGMSRPTSVPSLQDLGSNSFQSSQGYAMDPEGPQDVLTEKAPVGEQIFLVYFFVFNLMEFSKELTHLVSCVEELVDGDDGLPMWIERNRQPWWRRIWFSLTGFPRRLRRPVVRQQPFHDFDDPEPGNHPPASYHSHSRNASQGHNTSHSNNASSQGLRGRHGKQRLFPKPNMHNKADTLHTPRPSTFLQKWSTRLWKFLHVFRSFQVKYAAKTAVSAMVLLIPAFVDWTRPYFVQYRGEWALISMLIIMVPTVGGTNVVGIYRIMGTVVGCYIGVLIYLLFPADNILLPICCFLFAIPNFFLVLCSAYPRIGQVTLLAFNLVLIQTYNRRNGDGTVPPDDDEDDDDEVGGHVTPSKMLRRMGSLLGETNPNDPNHASYVWTIALHRAVAVSLGVVIGVLVTSYVWPYEARVELRKGLSDLLLNISWLYNQLVAVYSTNLDRVSVVPEQKPYRSPRQRVQEILRRSTFQARFQAPADEYEELPEDPTESDMDRMNKEFMAIELSLQLQLLKLYALLEETPNEPRLKGKFPVRTYKNMLGSCQNILDRFLSMRLVITKDEWIESARRDFIVPVNKERREMVGNVLLYFYTIASALRLKTPLPPYLPPANRARLRLIQKIRQLPVVQNKVVMTEDNDERYVFYYAYALVMDDVIRELERLGRWSQDLFGVITPAIEFEGWFTDDGGPPALLSPASELPSSATREAPLSPLHDFEQPFQYPERQHPFSSSAPGSQEQQQRAVQRPSSNPGKGRYRPDESSVLIDSESHSLAPDVQDRDGLFDFDSHDPFREISNSPLGQGGSSSSPFPRGARRHNSSTSLNDAMLSTTASQSQQQPFHDKGVTPHRQGSQAFRSSQGSRYYPTQRSYGSTATTQLPRNAVGAQRAASAGSGGGQSGSGRIGSSMKKSSSGSLSSYNRAATVAVFGEGTPVAARPLSGSGSNGRLSATSARNQEQDEANEQ
ncbi:hypothetical protein BGX29_000908 [Mortierella sp. GBA35]|nr:hypothetical protein BGX29_000908 [Mortierella sp. GBA35]